MKKNKPSIVLIVTCPKCGNENEKKIWKYGYDMAKIKDEIVKIQKYKCIICGHVWKE